MIFWSFILKFIVLPARCQGSQVLGWKAFPSSSKSKTPSFRLALRLHSSQIGLNFMKDLARENRKKVCTVPAMFPENDLQEYPKFSPF